MKHIDTIVLVRDIQKSKAFYSDVLGLEVLHDWDSMVVFKNRLALHQFDLLQPKDLIRSHVSAESIGSGNLIVYLSTDRIAEEFRRLSGLGVLVVHGIVDLPWQKVFRIRDLDGYLVEIGEEKET